ncbi:MAG: hypothetical protein ACRDTV_18495 [Mycobacterium sp.]
MKTSVGGIEDLEVACIPKWRHPSRDNWCKLSTQLSVDADSRSMESWRARTVVLASRDEGEGLTLCNVPDAYPVADRSV